MTQVYGLPKAAEEFLVQNTAVDEVLCPHCKMQIGAREAKEKHGELRSEGMFDDGPDIYKYRLKDGSIVFEAHQATVWSSGPCIFLKLVNEKGADLFVWKKEDIDNA